MYHLVTGACGYVGSNIVEELVKQGFKVISLDILKNERITNISKFYEIDVSNFDELLKITEDIDVIHHNAALVPLTKSGKKYFQVNTIGTRNIINFALKKKVKHLSHMSSSAIFSKKLSNNNIDITEYKPIDIYGVSKYLAELEIIKSINKLKERNTSYSIIRPRTIIGKGRLGIFSILFDWIKDDKKIPIIGDGNNLFQFAHVSDIVDVSIETSVKRISGFFNIGVKEFGTIKEDLNNFFKIVNSKSRVLPLNEKLAIFFLVIFDKLKVSPLSAWHYLSYSQTYYYDLENTFKILEWRPKYSNIDLLKNAYHDYLLKLNDQKQYGSAHKTDPKQKILKIIKLFM